MLFSIGLGSRPKSLVRLVSIDMAGAERKWVRLREEAVHQGVFSDRVSYASNVAFWDVDGCNAFYPSIRSVTHVARDLLLSYSMTAIQPRSSNISELSLPGALREPELNGITTRPLAASRRNPVDGEPWSATGRQANYESRPQPRGKYINNVHIWTSNEFSRTAAYRLTGRRRR